MLRFRALVTAFGLVALYSSFALGQQPAHSPTVQPSALQSAASQASVPAPEVLLMLVRTTLVAINQANFTGNYTVVHALGSPSLQARNSPADLGTSFADLRSRNLDLSPVLILAPQVTEAPRITPEGQLRFAGFFPTTPLQIQFAMVFLPVGGRWRIDGLSVGVATAPAPVPAAQAPVVESSKGSAAKPSGVGKVAPSGAVGKAKPEALTR